MSQIDSMEEKRTSERNKGKLWQGWNNDVKLCYQLTSGMYSEMVRWQGQKKVKQIRLEKKNNLAGVYTERNMTNILYVVGGRIQKAYIKVDQEDEVYRTGLRKVGVKT